MSVADCNSLLFIEAVRFREREHSYLPLPFAAQSRASRINFKNN